MTSASVTGLPSSSRICWMPVQVKVLAKFAVALDPSLSLVEERLPALMKPTRAWSKDRP